MLIAGRSDGFITLIGRKTHPYVAVVTLATAKGNETRLIHFGEGLRRAEIAVSRDVTAFEVVTLPLAKKLSQGQHKTPPKGYPTDRSEYAVPEDYEFPIDRKHIHAAISYFPKHHWKSGEHKRSAAKRILAAAKKFGVKVGKDDDVARAARGE